MHQGHNIPWDIIAANFKFKQDDTSFTPPFTGLVPNPLRSLNANKELKHFAKKFAQAIRTFSETERAKYPSKTRIPLRYSGPLFSDELRDKHPEYLNEKNQRIEYWIDSAKKLTNDGQPEISYNTSDAGLAEVVKVLLYENELGTLLMLARHPDIPIHELHSLHWGHHFGFSRVRESALRSYLFFNTAEATGTLEKGQYSLMTEYSSLLSEISQSMDYPAQQIPHLKFLRLCPSFVSQAQVKYGPQSGGDWIQSWAEGIYVHEDYGRLQAYLKELFALMYRYDVLVRECGLEILSAEWETELVGYHPLSMVLKVEHEWLEEEQRWRSFIV